MTLERTVHNLLMVTKESKHLVDAVEGLPWRDLWCLDMETKVCHGLSPQVQRHGNQDRHRWVVH